MRRLAVRCVLVASAFIIASCLLLPWALRGNVRAAIALVLLWMGLLGQHWFLKAEAYTGVRFGLNIRGPKILHSLSEGILALSLVLFQQSIAIADRSGVLNWLVGLLCIHAILFHGLNAFIQGGLRHARRPLPPDAPRIHYRWLDEELTWWMTQELLLILITLLVDGVKMLLLLVYLVELGQAF